MDLICVLFFLEESLNFQISCHLDPVQTQTSLASDTARPPNYHLALLSFNQSSVYKAIEVK